MAKFGAINAPMPVASARSRMAATWTSDIPVVPMTGDTPASSASSAWAAAASATEKSTTTSGEIA